jgi:hypothetical protein
VCLTQIVDALDTPCLTDYINDFSRTLKLSFTLQILVGLAITQSRVAKTRLEGMKILQTKLREYFDHGKP